MDSKTTLYSIERQNQILDLVKEKGTISVQELSDLFQVSTATIRSDLNLLEQQGELTRTHGGAIPKMPVRRESAISERQNEDKKTAIASKAVTLVSDYENILIDSGTTAMCFAKELVKQPLKQLRVYTNDLEVARTLEDNDNIKIHLFGGNLRSAYHYTYGEEVLSMLRIRHFNKVFLTTPAMDLTHGLTSTASHLSIIKREMINSSEEVILLADSTKYGQVCFQQFGTFEDVDILIVDDNLPADSKQILRKKVKTLHLV